MRECGLTGVSTANGRRSAARMTRNAALAGARCRGDRKRFAPGNTELTAGRSSRCHHRTSPSRRRHLTPRAACTATSSGCTRRWPGRGTRSRCRTTGPRPRWRSRLVGPSTSRRGATWGMARRFHWSLPRGIARARVRLTGVVERVGGRWCIAFHARAAGGRGEQAHGEEVVEDTRHPPDLASWSTRGPGHSAVRPLLLLCEASPSEVARKT
jgi:hypothetical protein